MPIEHYPLARPPRLSLCWSSIPQRSRTSYRRELQSAISGQERSASRRGAPQPNRGSLYEAKVKQYKVMHNNTPQDPGHCLRLDELDGIS
jgi:hypothetical protein